jgi:hypothetical protein
VSADGRLGWYWCLTHARVEHGPGCPDKERLGPYADEATAAAAVTRMRERTAAEDARDRAEDDW